MTTTRHAPRLGTALLIAIAATTLITGVALAHPESEGAHPSGCIVTAEPGTVASGATFTVAGNFGGASIFVLPGADAMPDEGATPNATTPAGDSFSVTFTALGPGDVTVVAVVPESGCGDTDHVTVTATVPNTATTVPMAGLQAAGAIVLVLALGLAARRMRRPAGY